MEPHPARGNDDSAIVPGTSLVVPASDPRKVARALASAADEVVLDLEDAVAIGAKDSARDHVVEVLAQQPEKPLAIRINQIGTAWCHRDVTDIVRASTTELTLVVPQVASAADVGFVDRMIQGASAALATSTDDTPTVSTAETI